MRQTEFNRPANDAEHAVASNLYVAVTLTAVHACCS
jgi:hypothetical protein